MNEQETYKGQIVGQSGTFHRNKIDDPVPTGEEFPLPTKKAGRKAVATIPAGEKASTAVDISGAESVAFVLPAAMTGKVLYFEVSDDQNGPFYSLCLMTTPIWLSVTESNLNAAVTLAGQEVLRPWQYLRLVSSGGYVGDVECEAEERQIQVHMK